jgi:hypothetical protein
VVVQPALTVVLGLMPWAVTVAHGMAGYDPDGINRGDFAFLELATRSALRCKAMVGPYSRFGWDHPGPAAFYWFAPFYEASGQQAAALGVAAAAIFGASLAVVIVACRRAAGPWAGVAAAVVCGWLVEVWGWRSIGNAWNPVVVVAPLFATGVLAAGVVVGRRWLLPVLVGAASFCVQSHVGTAPEALAWCAVGVAVALARGRTDRTWRGPAAAALGIGLALWAAPIGQQLAPGPGNLGQLVAFLHGTPGHHGLTETLDRLAPQLVPLDHDVVRRVSGGRPPVGSSPRYVVACTAVVAAAAASALRNRRLGRTFEASLCALGVAGAMLAVVASRRVAGVLEGYLTLPASPVGAVLWLGLATTGVAELHVVVAHVRPRLVRVLVPCIAVAVVVALLGAMADDIRVRSEGDVFVVHQNHPVEASRAVHALLDAVGPGSGLVRVDPDRGALLVAATFANQLERAGHAVGVEPRLLSFFGRDRRMHGCPLAVLRVGAKGAGLERGAGRVVAGYDGGILQLRKPSRRRCRSG